MSVASVKELKSDGLVRSTGVSRSILLVEDDPDAMEELTEILEFEGWMPLSARNVSGALAVIENSDVQLVITDVHLGNGSDPGESGIHLVSRAQAQFPDRNLSFIVLSGDVDAVKSSLQTDAVDFLLKPVASDDLIQAIEEAEQWKGKERKLSEFAKYLIRKTGRPTATETQSPNDKLVATEFDLKRRMSASSDEKSFVIQYVVGADQMQTFFSPVIGTDDRVIAIEAVPRWVDDSDTAADIQAFLDHARAADWATELDNKIRSQAAQTLSAHQDAFGEDHKVVVMFPAEQFMRDDGIRDFLRTLQRQNTSPEQVLLEITYTPALSETSDLLVKSHLGCFAGGLLRVDAQNVSNACGFVCRMASYGFQWVRLSMSSRPDWFDSPDAKAEIKALISIAHATGSKVIVDHVDAPEQLDWLKSEGCDAFQGEAVAEIMEADSLGASLKGGASA